jgi:hypothetical protein
MASFAISKQRSIHKHLISSLLTKATTLIKLVHNDYRQLLTHRHRLL